MAETSPRVTTQEGPSAQNQTSEDHSHDPNQKARQPSVDETLASEGVIITPESVDTVDPDANVPPV